MKWKILSMLDPGDGIVSTTIIEHESDDICEVINAAMNDECLGKDGELVVLNGWVFGVEALPPGSEG